MASLSYACNELVEAVLLFMGLQHDHVSRASLQQLKPELAVSMTAEKYECSSTEEKCSVRVTASGLGAYFLDGNSFLNKLCEHGLHLRYLLQATAGTGTNPSQLKLFCRRIGDHANVVVFELQGFSAENDRPLIGESVVPRPQDFPPAGLVISFTVNLSKEAVHSEASKLSAQLHLIHLINPEVPLRQSLRVKDNSGTAYTVQYDREPYRHVAHSPYKLITTLHHYMNPDIAPARQSRLYLLKGGTQTIPKISLKNGGTLPLKLYCTAAVTPHLPFRNGRKIPANKLCNSLHIWVFGPFQVPLLSAGAQANCLLGSLAEWDNYGLSIGLPVAPRYKHISSDDSLVIPSIACEVTNSRSGGEGRRSLVEANHTLKLFIFLENASSQGDRRAGSDNEQWRKNVELLYEVRRRFDSLVVTHSRKFHQAVHSVLNKLICNYGTHEKTSSVMGTAIPMIAEAVSSIVHHSSNEHFKATCRELVQTDHKDDVERFVTQKLWRMAWEKLKISHPSDEPSCNPDEPTSPEIIQATSNAEPRTIMSQVRSTVTTTTDETQHTESEGSEADAEAIQCTQEPDAESQRSSEILPSSFNSQCLFRARISSKRMKRSANESKDQCTKVVSQLECTELVGEDTDCFDALTTVEEDMEATADCVLTCAEADYCVDSQVEECSPSLLGSSTILQPIHPPPSTHPPTPSPVPPPSPPSLSLDSCMPETAATGFDELESVATEDEFSTVFGPPPAFEEPHHSVLERETSSTHPDQPLQAERQGAEQQTGAHEQHRFSEFHEPEGLSEIGSSLDDGSFTDWEVDFAGAFSTDGEELEDTVLEDTVACVPDCGYAQTSTESVLDQNTDNDSEWNDLTMDSPTLLPPPNQRETPAISILPVQYSNDQHLPAHQYHNSLLDCPKCVDINSEQTAGYMDHKPTSLCTNTSSQSCVSQVYVSNASPTRRTNTINDSWDLSDLEWDPEDFTDSANTTCTMTASLPASRKRSTQNSDRDLKHKFTTVQHPQQTLAGHLEASTVPDIMNESLTCEVAEEDFHWD